MKMIVIGIILLVAILFSSPVMPATVPAGENGDALEKLKQRVDILDRTVLVDPFHPGQTVLSRLDAAEKAITELQKHDTAAARVEGKDDESIRKSLSELQKDSDELNRRIKSAEDQLRRTPAGEMNDVRDLKRVVDQMGRTLDDLQNRVKRLETNK